MMSDDILARIDDVLALDVFGLPAGQDTGPHEAIARQWVSAAADVDEFDQFANWEARQAGNPGGIVDHPAGRRSCGRHSTRQERALNWAYDGRKRRLDEAREHRIRQQIRHTNQRALRRLNRRRALNRTRIATLTKALNRPLTPWQQAIIDGLDLNYRMFATRNSAPPSTRSYFATGRQSGRTAAMMRVDEMMSLTVMTSESMPPGTFRLITGIVP